LLATAIAGELGVPLFKYAGSSFSDKFVGSGASKVRERFDEARKHAPAVIFIDEVEAAGRERGTSGDGGGVEKDDALTQILTEIGSEESKERNKGLVFIIATNKPELLDKAFKRSGRMDRHYTIGLPDAKGRRDILKLHAKKLKLDPAITDKTFMELAKTMRTGASGADIEVMVNNAALLARHADQNAVTVENFRKAIYNHTYGVGKESMALSPREKRITAYHENAHALVQYVTAGEDEPHPVNFISVIPRDFQGKGTALGVMVPGEKAGEYNHENPNRADIQRQIHVAYAGRAGEEKYLGKGKYTVGASNDYEKATEFLLRAMRECAMYPEELGHISLKSDSRFAQPWSQKMMEKVEDLLIRESNLAYGIVSRFIESIPPDTYEQWVNNLEELETLDDPAEINAMYEQCGRDLKALWKDAVDKGTQQYSKAS
jgi:cell division protease FtsH